MRSAVALLAACAAAAAALAVVGARDERPIAFTTNVRPKQVVIEVYPGEQACQGSIQAGAGFDTVEFLLGTGHRPGPPLGVTVRDTLSKRVISAGNLPAGALDNQGATVRLDRTVAKGTEFDVCALNEGRHDVAFYGGPTDEAAGHSFIGRRPGAGDMRILFRRSEPRSALAQVPDMFERATRFRPEPVGAWTFWLLLVGVAGGIPLLLALALRSARRT